MMALRTHPRRAALLGLLPLALVSLSGCFGGPGAGGGETVTMQNVQFQPQELRIEPGTKVTWNNEDSVAHDVTSGDGSFQSAGGPGGMGQGESWSRTFSEPATYEYYCSIHSGGPGQGMSGRIVVGSGGAGNTTATM